MEMTVSARGGGIARGGRLQGGGGGRKRLQDPVETSNNGMEMRDVIKIPTTKM